MRYWLLKTEPEAFSFDDLLRAPSKTAGWDGVRNYQARNFLRDEMKKGDQVLIYHSNADPPAVVGVAEIVARGISGSDAVRRARRSLRPGHSKDAPRWFQVDVKALQKLRLPCRSDRGAKALSKMALLQRGQRLSVQPVGERSSS